MKKLLALATVLLLALVGWVAAGPFLAVRSIEAAVQRQDMRALDRHVDFPMLRASVRAQLEDYIARNGDDPRISGSLAQIGKEMTGVLAGGVVEALVTPAGIGAILQGRSVVRRAMGFPAEQGPGGDAAGAYDPLRNAQFRYVSVSEFQATVQNADGVPIVFVFTRDGLRWRITDMRLPIDRLVGNFLR